MQDHKQSFDKIKYVQVVQVQLMVEHNFQLNFSQIIAALSKGIHEFNITYSCVYNCLFQFAT
jgi:hypothetical protein